VDRDKAANVIATSEIVRMNASLRGNARDQTFASVQRRWESNAQCEQLNQANSNH
jgi:hypothetical protein